MLYNEACMNYPAILLIIDPNSGDIVSANKKAAEVYEYSIEQLCTMKISDINVLKKDQVQNEIKCAISQSRNYFHFPHKTASGKIINMEVESYPTIINNKSYLFSIIYKSNERNIYVNASLNLMNHSTDSILITDQLNRIIKINKSAEDFLRIKEKNYIGEDISIILKNMLKEKYDYLISEIKKGNSTNLYCNFNQGKENLICKLFVIPTYYLNHYFGAVISISIKSKNYMKEIDNKNKLEKKLVEIEKSNSLKDDFLARMSHDMRTPMNAILGMSNFGLEEVTDPLARKYFLQIKDSSEYLLTLINDILDMQKLERGKIELNCVVTNTPSIVQKVKNIIIPRAKQKGVELIFNLECEGLFNYVYVDEKRIEQVLINILSNAIKYTPKGGCVIWRDFVDKLPNGNIVINHEIQDNGVGMSAEFQKKMFEPFETEMNSQSILEGGSGLGLAISYNLIHEMGGKISCDSKLNKGTTFFIEIVLSPASDEDIEDYLKVSKKVNNLDIIKDKKILLCEDVDVNIMIVKKLLEFCSYPIDIAKDGKEGVKLAKKNSYDIILMDIRMPILNGLSATKEIRKFDKDVAIVGLSANVYSDDIKKSLKVGMDCYIAKPIIKDDFYSKLISVIG